MRTCSAQRAIGIDAFALNIGTDPYTIAQLDLAYASAANNNMKVFISFDFNWYHPGSDAVAVGQMIARYASHPAQLHVNNKVFVSSFAGDGLDVNSMRNAAGTPVFWAPNYHPGQGNVNDIDGALNWLVRFSGFKYFPGCKCRLSKGREEISQLTSS